MQTQSGRALAVPLFVVLAQNRALHIVGQDKGVGQVDPTLRAEDRIRVVSDRFDQANRLLVQASLCTIRIPGWLLKLQSLYSITLHLRSNERLSLHLMHVWPSA